MTATTGNIYRIKCGWGWTKARLEYITNMNGKKCYHWKQTSSEFRFVSYDLENTREVTA